MQIEKLLQILGRPCSCCKCLQKTLPTCGFLTKIGRIPFWITKSLHLLFKLAGVRST